MKSEDFESEFLLLRNEAKKLFYLARIGPIAPKENQAVNDSKDFE